MGLKKDKWHFLTEKNLETMTGICSLCGEVKLQKITKADGTIKIFCIMKVRAASVATQRKIKARKRAKKGNTCTRCGFTGYPCQIDIHHRDGNHQNNSPDNLEVICARCHRLENIAKDGV